MPSIRYDIPLKRGDKIEVMVPGIMGGRGLGYVWEYWRNPCHPDESSVEVKLCNPQGKRMRALRYEMRVKRDQSGIRPDWVFHDERFDAA